MAKVPASSTPASPSTGWVSPMSRRRPLCKSAPLLPPAQLPSRCSIPCAIHSPAAALGASRAAPYPVACRTSPDGALFRCGCHLPTTRSTPRVSVSALPHWPQRWTTCRPRPCALRAGAPTATGCAGSHLLQVDFAASGRCGRAGPPGGRLSRFDPVARRLSRIREVDEVLAHAHAMALYALENPRRDTS